MINLIVRVTEGPSLGRTRGLFSKDAMVTSNVVVVLGACGRGRQAVAVWCGWTKGKWRGGKNAPKITGVELCKREKNKKGKKALGRKIS